MVGITHGWGLTLGLVAGIGHVQMNCSGQHRSLGLADLCKVVGLIAGLHSLFSLCF